MALSASSQIDEIEKPQDMPLNEQIPPSPLRSRRFPHIALANVDLSQHLCPKDGAKIPIPTKVFFPPAIWPQLSKDQDHRQALSVDVEPTLELNQKIGMKIAPKALIEPSIVIDTPPITNIKFSPGLKVLQKQRLRFEPEIEFRPDLNINMNPEMPADANESMDIDMNKSGMYEGKGRDGGKDLDIDKRFTSYPSDHKSRKNGLEVGMEGLEVDNNNIEQRELRMHFGHHFKKHLMNRPEFILPNTVDIELKAFQGVWFQTHMSLLPAKTIEKDMVCVTAKYGGLNGEPAMKSLLGIFHEVPTFHVRHSGNKHSQTGASREGHGTAWQFDPMHNSGKLVITMNENIWQMGGYFIHMTGPINSDGRYEYAVITDCIGSGLWILARKPKFFRDSGAQDKVLAQLDNEGFNKTWNKPRETYQGRDCIYQNYVYEAFAQSVTLSGAEAPGERTLGLDVV